MELATIGVLSIWIAISVLYFLIPYQKFGEPRIKIGIYLMLFSTAVLNLVYIDEMFHFTLWFVFAAVLITCPPMFGFFICLDSGLEYKLAIPLSFIYNAFFISLLLFYLPFHPFILILLLIWITIFDIYILILFPLIKFIDFRKKFGILLFMIAMCIFSFGLLSPLIHHLKTPLFSTPLTFISFNIDLKNGIVFLKIFNDLAFFTLSWIAIFTFTILSFIPDAAYEDSQKLVNILKVVVLFTFHCFLITLVIFWIPDIVAMIIVCMILIAIDIFAALSWKKYLKK